jgi:ectoine hydroxylase-related dioxygenase (phytanoyl-CoA dioxygenase family)
LAPASLSDGLVENALEICLATLARKRALVTRLPLEQYARFPFAEMRDVAEAQVASIIAAACGADSRLTEAWIRASGPPGQARHVHRDKAAATTGPARYGVDLLLTAFTEDNGATAIWAGSHQDARQEVPSGEYGRRPPGEPVRLTGPAGAIVVRDLRAWHQAMANRTSEPRVMLSYEVAERGTQR